MSTWIYCAELLLEAPEDYQGFVYCITNTKLNKHYIGKKLFWTVKKLPPLKGRKNKRHIRTETDWRDYWGSSNQLLQDLEQLGTEHFTRKVLKLCKTKSELSYVEAKLQFDHDVLIRDDYYNGIINCRITSRGL